MLRRQLQLAACYVKLQARKRCIEQGFKKMRVRHPPLPQQLLHAVRLMGEAVKRDPIQPSFMTDGVRLRLHKLMQYVPVGERIESFWRTPEHRRSLTWSEHRDINEVMLATSLVPEGFLVLPSLY